VPGQHSFASKAQWRWAFASHQPFARRWADTTKYAGRGYKGIPRRKHPPSASRAARAFLNR
jgi:hypothetical protein